MYWVQDGDISGLMLDASLLSDSVEVISSRLRSVPVQSFSPLSPWAKGGLLVPRMEKFSGEWAISNLLSANTSRESCRECAGKMGETARSGCSKESCSSREGSDPEAGPSPSPSPQEEPPSSPLPPSNTISQHTTVPSRVECSPGGP